MDSLTQIHKEEIALKKQIDKLVQRKVQAIRNQYFQCNWKSCGKRSQLHTCIYIQTHYYIPPHGCTEGDYWLPGEVNIICPKCKTRHRLIHSQAQPDNYHQLSYTEQRKLDDRPKQAIIHYNLENAYPFEIFDNCLDYYGYRYDKNVRPRRLAGKTVQEDRKYGEWSFEKVLTEFNLNESTFTDHVDI